MHNRVVTDACRRNIGEADLLNDTAKVDAAHPQPAVFVD